MVHHSMRWYIVISMCLTTSAWSMEDNSYNEVTKDLIELMSSQHVTINPVSIHEYVQHGADVNATVNGYSLLHLAIKKQHTSLLKELLSCNSIDVNHKHPRDGTPLMLATKKPFLAGVQQLLEHPDIDPNEGTTINTPLIIAFNHDLSWIISALMAHPKTNLCAQDADQNTIFHIASQKIAIPKKHAPLLGKCFTNKTQHLVNAKNKQGNTPLMTALWYRNTAAANLLLQKKADINCANNENNTPLHVALMNLDEKCALTLLKDNTVQTTVANIQLHTPLHYACQYNLANVVKMLLSKDLNKSTLNAADSQGATPLHKAAFHGSIDALKILLQEPTLDVNVLNKSHQTPLHYCIHYLNRLPVIKQLLDDHRVNQMCPDTHGNSPLHEAVRWNKLPYAALLLNNPSVTLTCNLQDKSPFDLVKKAKKESWLRLFARYGFDLEPLHTIISKAFKNSPLIGRIIKDSKNIIDDLEKTYKEKKERKHQQESCRHYCDILDDDQATAFMYAVAQRKLSNALWLLAYGHADPFRKDNRGNSAISLLPILLQRSQQYNNQEWLAAYKKIARGLTVWILGLLGFFNKQNTITDLHILHDMPRDVLAQILCFIVGSSLIEQDIHAVVNGMKFSLTDT